MPCEPIQGPGFTGIICRGRQRTKRCHYCDKPAPYLCDHPVVRKGVRGTCDTKLCPECRNEVAGNTDLCRPHFNLWRNNGCCFKLGDVEIKENGYAKEL